MIARAAGARPRPPPSSRTTSRRARARGPSCGPAASATTPARASTRSSCATTTSRSGSSAGWRTTTPASTTTTCRRAPWRSSTAPSRGSSALRRRPPVARTFGAGGAFSFAPSDIHRVLHAGDGPAVTLHAYSPPLWRMGAYEVRPTGAAPPLALLRRGAAPAGSRLTHRRTTIARRGRPAGGHPPDRRRDRRGHRRGDAAGGGPRRVDPARRPRARPALPPPAGHEGVPARARRRATTRLLHPEGWWDEHGVELLTRTSVTALDPAARTATLSTKEDVAFGQALVATGAMVRRLRVDGAQLEGIHYLRAPGNADALRADLDGARRVVCVGGSYIGCEVAASLTELGLRRDRPAPGGRPARPPLRPDGRPARARGARGPRRRGRAEARRSTASRATSAWGGPHGAAGGSRPTSSSAASVRCPT